jgi:SAM-dependent methyltransferase
MWQLLPPSPGAARRGRGRRRPSLFDDPRVYDVIQTLCGSPVTAGRYRRALAPAAGCEVLDVGAGTGNLAQLLPPGARYTALDNDPAKLSRLQRKLPTARCLLRSGLDTGLPDGAVDWTMCVAVAHHLDAEQLPLLIAELARVTRDRLMFVDPVWTGRRDLGRLLWRYDRGSHPRSAEALLAALRAQFAPQRIERFRVLHEYLLCVCRPLHT